MIGGKIGHYEVLELMGVGGMGEVYRARDLTLGRQVAIKVLPDEWAEDDDRLARLQREAKVLAQLDHTNIAAIHGLEEVTAEDGSAHRLLVMQLAEGETLQEWIAAGRIGTERALRIGLQIATGLEAAHERGVVHRDLKPANVKVSEDAGGHPHVKLLDFGLAKAHEPDGSASDISPETSASPTVLAATRTGVILGTAAYMSPEQARGKAVDKRTDIWAFGVVMFEMFTGQRLFAGETVSDMLAAVLKTDPDYSRLPHDVPGRVVRLLERCLQRDPTQRLRDIGEARLVLENPESAAPGGGPRTGEGVLPAAHEPTLPARGGAARLAPWLLAGAALVLAAWAWLQPAPAADRGFELAIAPPSGSSFVIGENAGNVIVSPDGDKVAFVATTEDGGNLLWVRRLQENRPFPLPGTETVQYPFWSHDGTRIGFFAAGQLKTVDISGGIPVVVAPADNGRGGSWGDDGFILFTPQGADVVHRVHESGGPVTEVTRFDEQRGENAHYWPVVLPGSEYFLYFGRARSADNSGVFWARTDGTGTPVRVVPSMASAIHAPPHDGHPGYLLWARDETLLAQPFDADTGSLGGTARPIAEGVRVGDSQRAAFAGVSDNGMLVWADARAADHVARSYSRAGLVTGTFDIESGAIVQPALSPDGRRLLFSRPDQGTSDILLYDVETMTTRPALATPGYDELPSWLRDGTSFVATGDSGPIMLVDAGSNESRIVLEGWDVAGGSAITPDGRFLFSRVLEDDGAVRLLVSSVDDPSVVQAHPLRGTRDWVVDFSPEGDWAVLVSDRVGGEFRLWIAPVEPDGELVRLGEPWIQVASGMPLASATVWTHDDEILFVGADNRVGSVQVTRNGSELDLSREQVLFRVPDDTESVSFSADGEHIVVVSAPFAAGQTIALLTDWHTRLDDSR